MRSGLLIVILVAGAVAVVGWAIALYNRLVKRRNHVEDGWSGIEVQLTKRHQLIPNLVEVVKKYALHEQSTLQRVIELREGNPVKALPKDTREQAQAMTHALHGLMVRLENYPELKADENFRRLQEQLSSVEEDIQYARRYFNGAVREYNTLVQSFPANMIAQRYGFLEAEFFELEDEAARQAPQVRL